jgi:hypothetical protein
MRQSQSWIGLRLLWLWDWRRQITRRHGVGEVLALVGAVAEGLVARMAAAAEGNGGPSSQAECVAFLILHFEIAFHSDRAVVNYRYFGCWQGILHWFSLQTETCFR